MITRFAELERQVAELSGDKKNASRLNEILKVQEKEIERARTKHISEIRKEVAGVSDRGDALKSIAYLDDLIITTVFLAILAEIKKINEAALETAFQRVTGKDLKKEFNGKTIADIFKLALGCTLESKFNQYLKATNFADVNEASVNKLIEEVAAGFYQKVVCRYVDNAANKPVFFKIAVSEFLCACATEIFSQTVHRQTQNMAALALSLVGLSQKKILKPFSILKFGLAHLHLTPETRGLWQEFALWSEGLHLRHFNALSQQAMVSKRDIVVEDGKIVEWEDGYLPVSDKDRKLKQLFDLTFYKLVLRNLDMANILQYLLAQQALEQEKLASPTAVGFFSAASAAAPTESDSLSAGHASPETAVASPASSP